MASTGIGTETGAIIASPALQREAGAGQLAQHRAAAGAGRHRAGGLATRGHARPHPAGHPALAGLDREIHHRALRYPADACGSDDAGIRGGFLLATLLGIALAIIITYSEIAREAL